jgi:HD superfamily phosphohydrolase
MRRDRFMTGTQSSAIDFEWLVANLDVRRVVVGQDEKEIRKIDTLVVGQKALLAAEAYVLGLFHLYPNVYYHKATRSAEKIFSALLAQIFKLVVDGSWERTGLPAGHPLVLFAKAPDDLKCFYELDDYVVWGAMPLLGEAKDSCVGELSRRLVNRKLYKVIDVTARVETALSNIKDEKEREEKCRKTEAEIRVRVRESGLLESNDSAPLALDDVVKRDPYQQGQGDAAALKMIYAVDRTGETKELSRLSKVVEALKTYEAYRIYFRDDDAETKAKLDTLIGECHD